MRCFLNGRVRLLLKHIAAGSCKYEAPSPLLWSGKIGWEFDDTWRRLSSKSRTCAGEQLTRCGEFYVLMAGVAIALVPKQFVHHAIKVI
uniref:Uncharacterized protein n=1 Tax=Physcomitrium patens TaxID=3218 RepID=A0A2K1JH44_PHYPA|nr:hypothetical protein PHYPA_018280 [Physcomitrium patens]